ncbi:MAG TPA: Dam family site-specific DNA-(adenine-N6)-methyltransferase [Vicinamibacterales bacterium]|nr:Dam family site-specific DNA-(adenine-N6)-methyltransferase [Vicinamibacterales bacterium]
MTPLLKWVGGKRQLLPQLRQFYPRAFGRYIEPFFGSGAVFFDLHASGRLQGRDAVLIDSNADLIGCYETLRDATDAVAGELERLAAGHAAGGRAHYFDVRDERFNRLRQERRAADGRIAYTPELAAMLIYLNRTGFNGLFRLNKRGAFNVPPGRYDRPKIADRAKLARVADALRTPGVQLVWGGFERALEFARDGDFLYFDPPYAPVSRTANFTSYTSPRFDAADQVRLQRVVVELARRGCDVLVSNSTAAEIGALYERSADAHAAGLHAFRVAARRAVNSDASRRGPVEEYLISNVKRDQTPATQTN